MVNNDMHRISDRLRHILYAHGWSADRDVDVTSWRATLESEGFDMCESALRILRNFGGLSVHPFHDENDKVGIRKLRFDPVWAARGEYDRMELWEQLLKVRLSPIGEIGEETILLMAPNVYVYASWGPLLWYVGENFVDALENVLVFSKRPLKQIGADYEL